MTGKISDFFCTFAAISHPQSLVEHLFKENLKGKENPDCQHSVSCKF